jgi:hypothetical protein
VAPAADAQVHGAVGTARIHHDDLTGKSGMAQQVADAIRLVERDHDNADIRIRHRFSPC